MRILLPLLVGFSLKASPPPVEIPESFAFRKALQMACLNATCASDCQKVSALKERAAEMCRESSSAFSLSCPSIKLDLESFLKEADSLQGEDDRLNLVECAVAGTEKERDIYHCELGSGQRYARLQISAVPNPVGERALFSATVLYEDLLLSKPPKSIECRVKVDVGS